MIRTIFATVAATALTQAAVAGGGFGYNQFGDLGWGAQGSQTSLDFDSLAGASGIGSSNFWTRNYQTTGGDFLTLGLKASSYYDNMPTDGGDPRSGGNGSIGDASSNSLYNDGAGTYYGSAGGSTGGGNAGNFKWSFDWAFTVNGEIPSDANYDLTFNFFKPGSLTADKSVTKAANATFSGENLRWGDQFYANSWNFGYTFFSLAGFDPDVTGEYKIELEVSQGGTEITSHSMLIDNLGSQAVPGVGGLAPLAAMGLVGRRRRR